MIQIMNQGKYNFCVRCVIRHIIQHKIIYGFTCVCMIFLEHWNNIQLEVVVLTSFSYQMYLVN